MRKSLFWLIDKLKGGVIKNHFNEIQYIQHNFKSPKSLELRTKYLHDLLAHAVSNTDFYKEVNSTSLDEFPVINKNIIKNNFEALKSKKFIKKRNFKVSSSGSTGTPFKLYQNSNKRKRNIADTIFFGEAAGFKFGSKLVFLRVWTQSNKKSKLLSWVQNVVMQDVSNLNDGEIGKLIDYLKKDKTNKSLLSYASTLETVCKYLERRGVESIGCNIETVIANSEHLNEYTREAVPRLLNTSIYSRYSNAENGILSQQTRNSGRDFIINWASYYIEILKIGEDVVAAPGEIGRVVVTDLFNFCMPIIRYDTGDLACIEENKDGMLVFKSVEGRIQDVVYNCQNELISSFTIGGLMKKYSNLKQFQFIQEEKGVYRLLINPHGDFDSELDLILEFKRILGKNAQLRIEYINDIPHLASGKRRQVVNNYITDQQGV